MRNWKFWLGIAVSVFFLWWTFTGLDLQNVWSEMINATYWWLIPSVATYFLAVWVRTWRWGFMLQPLARISISRLFPVVVIGYMGNNIFPFRAGEVLRSYVLQKREQVAISASLATVIVERVFDGLVMLVFVFVALPFVPLPEGYNFIVIGASAAFFAAMVAFFALAAVPETALMIVEGIARWLPSVAGAKLIGITRRFLDGLKSLRSFRNVLMIFLTSVVIWLLETVKYWFIMHAFDFGDAHVTFFGLMLMNGVVNLATTLPSAPGYIGTFDKPGIDVLTAYGVQVDTASAYTFVLHAALLVPITLLGFYYMVKEGLRWGELNRAVQVRDQNAGVNA